MTHLYDIIETRYVDDGDCIDYYRSFGPSIDPAPKFCNVADCINYITDRINTDLKRALDSETRFGYDYHKLNFITRVTQYDPYTAIIDASGNKYLVKAGPEGFDKEKGLMECLFKYLAPSERYSEIMNLYPDDPKLEKAAIKGALVSYIGQDDFDKFMKNMGNDIKSQEKQSI